jgi:hypothetical protein
MLHGTRNKKALKSRGAEIKIPLVTEALEAIGKSI